MEEDNEKELNWASTIKQKKKNHIHKVISQ